MISEQTPLSNGKRDNAESPLKTKKKRKMELFSSVLPKLVPVCSYQSTSQLCPEGSHCLFSHRSSHSYLLSNSQKSVCKNWVEGSCSQGAQCTFLHQYIYHLLPQCTQDFQQGFCDNPVCMLKHINDKRRSSIEHSIALSASSKEKASFSRGDCLNTLISLQTSEGYWETSDDILQILGIPGKAYDNVEPHLMALEKASERLWITTVCLEWLFGLYSKIMGIPEYEECVKSVCNAAKKWIDLEKQRLKSCFVNKT